MDNEMSNENQTLEESALAEANSTPPAEKPAFSEGAIAEISKQRSRAQQAEVREANLQGQLQMSQQMNTRIAPPAKSPLHLRAEEEGVGIDEVQMDGALYQAQKLFDEQTANAKTAADTESVKQQSRDAATQKHPDWLDVITTGQDHLTMAEVRTLENAGMDFGEQAYDKCKVAIARLKPKEEKVAPDKDPSKEPDKETTVKSQKQILEGVDAATERVMDM